MRVLYVSRGYTSHDRRFLAALAERGHTAGLLRTEGIALEDRSLPDGVIEISGSVEEALAVFEPDVTQAGPVPTCAFLAARANARPLVAVSWGSDLLNLDESLLGHARYALAQCDLFLCDSLEVDGAARRLFDIPGDRIVQFPWGVDLPRFLPAPVRPEVMQIVCTRAWEPGYGIETVLSAFAAARQSEPQLCMTLFGGGSLEPKIQRFLVQNRLTQAVMMRGRVAEDELPLYLSAADLYLSAAPVDGSSISLLEAMATGLPVIVADRPSNREWVTPGVNGWLAPPGDVRAFARAMVEAARASMADRERIRAANLALARSRANWTKHAATYVSALEHVASPVHA